MWNRRALLHPGWPLFVIALAAYGYFYQAGGWNQNVRFDLTRAVVEQGTVQIDRYHRNTGDKSCFGPNGRCIRARPDRGEHYYCDKAPGVSLLGVPPYALSYWLAGSERPSLRYLVATSHLVTVFSIALPSAIAVAALFVLLAVMGIARSVCALLSLGWGLATLAFPYATLLYGHQLAAGLLLIGFALLVKARRTPTRRAWSGLVGVCLGFAVVSEYPAALAVIPITLYALAFLRPWRRVAWFILGGAVCALMLAGYHWLAFGGPLTLPYEFSTQKYRGLGYFMGLGLPNWDAFSNTIIGPYRGLFYSAPWLLGALPGAIVWWRRGYRAETAVCMTSFLLFMWMVSSLIESWTGGWSLGSRYMIPAIPFLVVLTGGIAMVDIGARMWLRGVMWGLAAIALGYSTLLMLAGTSVRPEVPEQIMKPFEQYLMPSFYQGQLALNPQHIDQIGSLQGGPRQAWNLGMLLGLDGLASLVPLFGIWALCGAWLAWSLRRDDADAVGDDTSEPATDPPAADDS